MQKQTKFQQIKYLLNYFYTSKLYYQQVHINLYYLHPCGKLKENV